MGYQYGNLKYGSYSEILASYHDPVGGRTLCCAHRSYWKMFPENSVSSILAALEYGCDMIEIDVRVTKDGICVLSHDNNLGRCTNAPTEIAMLNLDEIEYDKIKHLKLRFGTGGKSTMISDEHMCLLEEAVLLCENRALINLDKVMEDLHLRDCVYETLLRIEKNGHKAFEHCIFKNGQSSLSDVLAWIREKEKKDGVKINYAPWGVAGAEYLVKNGYHPYLFECDFNVSNELVARRKQISVGHMANHFADRGEDSPEHWLASMRVGVSVIHTDDARNCPKAIRSFWADQCEITDGTLIRYNSPCKDLTVPDGVKSIASNAFDMCKDLQSVILPAGLERIEKAAFAGCFDLHTVVLQSEIKYIGDHAFPVGAAICSPPGAVVRRYAQNESVLLTEYTEALSYKFEITKGRISLTRYLGECTDVIIPDTLLGLPVYEIGNGCFSNTSVQSVCLSDNTEMIEDNAFLSCKALKSVTFGSSIQSIAITAFDDCDRTLTIISAEGSYPNRYARAKGLRCIQTAEERIDTFVFPGKGTPEEPFLISNEKDLCQLSRILKEDSKNIYANSYYLQTADICFDTKGESNFDPIGQDGGVFRGSYNGNGYVIHGLRICTSIEGASLFGYINGAELSNIITDDIVVTANARIGGMVGVMEHSVVKNCHTRHFNLMATLHGYCNIGGLIGEAYQCRITNSSAEDGKIIGFRDLGGFMGEANHSVVKNCFAKKIADLNGLGNACGGFVGNFKGATEFQNCYTAANVCGALRVGAFSGFSGMDSRAKMKHCIALGNVKSCRKDTHGGLTGARVVNVVDCYYSDKVENISCQQGTAISPDDIDMDAICSQCMELHTGL